MRREVGGIEFVCVENNGEVSLLPQLRSHRLLRILARANIEGVGEFARDVAIEYLGKLGADYDDVVIAATFAPAVNSASYKSRHDGFDLAMVLEEPWKSAGSVFRCLPVNEKDERDLVLAMERDLPMVLVEPMLYLASNMSSRKVLEAVIGYVVRQPMSVWRSGVGTIGLSICFGRWLHGRVASRSQLLGMFEDGCSKVERTDMDVEFASTVIDRGLVAELWGYNEGLS